MDIAPLPVVVELKHGFADALGRRSSVDGAQAEISSIGCASEKKIHRALAHNVLHCPSREQGRAPRAQAGPKPVLLGMEVPPTIGGPQPHVRAVGEELHSWDGKASA